MEINEISGIVVDAAMKVHTVLGAGLLEHAYQVCLKHEIVKRGLRVQSEVELPIVYEGLTIDIGYRLDLLVEDKLIVETKAVSQISPIHKAQLLTYLKLTQKTIGLLLNFNTPHMRDGIFRLINSSASSASSVVAFENRNLR